MGPYLLKRRLRHVRSVKINNLCVTQKNSDDLFRFPSYFIVLENSRGETLYVSEVQNGSLYSVQFNELPLQHSPLTLFILKLFAEVPGKLSPYEDKVWCLFKNYKIDLNRMQYLKQDDIVGSYNAPLLELIDGNYVLPEVPIFSSSSSKTKEHKRKVSSLKNKPSFSFNYVLKLNKILEYTSQVMEESRQLSSKLELQIQNEHKKHIWVIDNLKHYNQQMKARIQKKRLELKKLDSMVALANTDLELPSEPHTNPLNDYYGNTYPSMVDSRNKLEALRTKKLAQLVSIFQMTELFHVRTGFATFDQSHQNASLYDKLSLQYLNKEELLKLATSGTKDVKKLTSTCLGYYTMFVTLIATQICSIPLPHVLWYCGSTSVINGTVPLYLDNNRDTTMLSQAIDYFNRDVVQIIQYLKHRRAQVVDNQNN
ncbi:BN860_15808g1_1 [Zygosaccharomyces bailii CLIB 213]|uniref:BN860_15808g1_1 n=1 Tax=Zygosaccharomyces bailii (strain CLIB 213 / ATCC 58445 / CBS 680 / BCRC 21525 / NBRC 1098 / NCYC 1416 / NRRL Y-2227) TaxID=1333698 RepID=A0A8J2T0R5_ZYGB2|nr:BN860_15808g1_1 [Zygosaccharomyces bailii CLIB 213]